MVPEEADRLDEKFDSLGRNAKRAPLLYEAQDDIEHDARDAAPQHRLCLHSHHHDAGSRNPGNQAGQSPASNAPGLTKSLATSAAKAAGGI